jgi:hypothetical protein
MKIKYYIHDSKDGCADQCRTILEEEGIPTDGNEYEILFTNIYQYESTLVYNWNRTTNKVKIDHCILSDGTKLYPRK